MLKGPLHSLVDITLSRPGNSNKHFSVRVMRHGYHEYDGVDTPRSGTDYGGFLGIEVTKDPPHRVLAVDDLLDANAVLQGEPGYSNAYVLPGDRIIALDGKPAERVPVILFCFHVSYLAFHALMLAVTLLLLCPLFAG